MIFTGIEVMFFTLGVITCLGTGAIIHFNKKYKFKPLVWAMLITGAFLLWFSIAWSWSSFLEGEPRSSSMGLVVFGIPAIIFLLLGRKLALKK
jgi:hypothetical protein